jgi:hypothetical protein
MIGTCEVPFGMGLCGMMYIPSFLKIGTGVTAILRFCFSSLRGCSVGITDGGGGFMKYAVLMDLGTMINVPSFIVTGSSIQSLLGGDTHTHRQKGDLINIFSFFQNKESRLKKI